MSAPRSRALSADPPVPIATAEGLMDAKELVRRAMAKGMVKPAPPNSEGSGHRAYAAQKMREHRARKRLSRSNAGGQPD